MLFKACFCDAGGSQENWQQIPSLLEICLILIRVKSPGADPENSERGGT